MALFGAGPRQPAIAWTLSSGGGALGVVLAIACNVDPGHTGQFAPHCADDKADQTCQQSHPSKPFCSLCVPLEQDQGCIATAPVPACRPGGAPTSGPADDGMTDDGSTTTGQVATDDTVGSTSVAVDDSDSGSSSSSGGIPCDNEGELDPECEMIDGARPYCFSGVCSDCSEAGGDFFCDGLDAATPACDGEAGTCVACFEVERSVCDGAAPICDATGGSCLPCTEHDQCSSGACHLSALDPVQGACFSPDTVVWVDNSAICPGMGTEANPSCSLASELASIDDGEEGVINVVAGMPYDEDVVMNQAATVAVLGMGTPVIVSESGSHEPTFDLSGGGLLYLSRVRLNNNENEPAITCSGASAVASDCEIALNNSWGISGLSPCDIELTRTTMHHNTIGGVRLLGGHLQVTNTTIGENGNGVSGPGVSMFYADVDVLYSTIAGNDAFGPDSIACEGGVEGTLRNSIVTGVDGESVDIDCFSLDMDYNAIDSSSFGSGTNTEVGPYNDAYFSDPGDGNFQISAPPLTPFGDVALWEDGMPLLDADGTERPTGGTLGFAGIDEP